MRDPRSAIEAKWSVKVRAVLGPRSADHKTITILGRGVAWKDDDAIEYSAEPARRAALLRAFELEERSKGTVDMGLGMPDREMAEKAGCGPCARCRVPEPRRACVLPELGPPSYRLRGQGVVASGHPVQMSSHGPWRRSSRVTW